MNHDLIKDAMKRVVKEAIRQASADVAQPSAARIEKLVADGMARLQANVNELGIETVTVSGMVEA